MPSPSNLVARIAAAMGDAGVAASRPVVVGCSGGPDSVVLADVLMRLAATSRGGPVTLVYVDHGLREDTAREAALVGSLAASGGAGFRSVTVDVPRDQASLEDAARRVRHRALAGVATELGAVIALAHTASDQAETVLMRILRGTGVIGLAAIPPRRGDIVRPMLAVWGDEIDSYVVERELATADDPMNHDQRFLRVRARRTLLPMLREENPAIDAALVRLASTAREHREMLDELASPLLGDLAPDGSMVLDVARLRGAPRAVRKRALAIACERAGGEPLESAHLETLMDLVSRTSDGTIDLDLPGLRISRIYDQLRFGRGEEQTLPPLEITGLDGPYEVRLWRPGDRMRPKRLKGRSRKLSDLYVDAKVPRDQRRCARVVIRSRDGVILWAEHIGPAWETAIQVVLTPNRPVASNRIDNNLRDVEPAESAPE